MFYVIIKKRLHPKPTIFSTIFSYDATFIIQQTKIHKIKHLHIVTCAYISAFFSTETN